MSLEPDAPEVVPWQTSMASCCGWATASVDAWEGVANPWPAAYEFWPQLLWAQLCTGKAFGVGGCEAQPCCCRYIAVCPSQLRLPAWCVEQEVLWWAFSLGGSSGKFQARVNSVSKVHVKWQRLCLPVTLTQEKVPPDPSPSSPHSKISASLHLWPGCCTNCYLCAGTQREHSLALPDVSPAGSQIQMLWGSLSWCMSPG